jgi:hypothetical protein
MKKLHTFFPKTEKRALFSDNPGGVLDRSGRAKLQYIAFRLLSLRICHLTIKPRGITINELTNGKR